MSDDDTEAGMREVRVVAAVIVRDGRALAARRGTAMSLPGLWEFPGGKVEPGESDAEALVREIFEELGLTVTVGELVGENVHEYPTIRVRLVAFVCTAENRDPLATEHDALRWVDSTELSELTWAAADVPLLRVVAARLSGA